jgi:hypothetical protein
MKSLCILFILFEFIINVPAIGQEGKELKNEIGISIFATEYNSEMVNLQLDPKLVFSVNYNRYYSNWSWISGFGFGRNLINDECRQCMDTFYGKGKMTELIASSGLRYTFLKGRKSFIKPFLESDLYYSYIRYTGDFKGGLSGAGTLFDNSYNVAGISFKTGLSVYPVQNISITFLSSLRYGGGLVRDHYTNSTDPGISLALAVVQIGIGYLF